MYRYLASVATLGSNSVFHSNDTVYPELVKGHSCLTARQPGRASAGRGFTASIFWQTKKFSAIFSNSRNNYHLSKLIAGFEAKH